ncbi:MAG: cyclase family protein [Solibacillus sp.]
MWLDITMPMHKNMPIWPGDTPFSYTLDATLEQDGANVGSVQMSLHTGTHVDAPYHYDDFGKAINVLPLELFIGSVLITDLENTSEITVSMLENLNLAGNERVFFKTKQHYDTYTFEPNYTVFTPEAITFLAQQGVRVIGTDAPSIDAFEDHTLRAHHMCKELDIYIIENLWLKDVLTGLYDFIGLPLNLQGADASPIRAVIKKQALRIE